MADQKNDDRGCPHALCGHSQIVHVEQIDGYGRDRTVRWGKCSVCASQLRQGEAGEFPCAAPADVA